jgi:hypothetical protein
MLAGQFASSQARASLRKSLNVSPPEIILHGIILFDRV